MFKSESQEYNLNAHNQTYNVQDELRRYRLKRYLKQTATVLAKTKDTEHVDEQDPLLNYDIDKTNQISRSERQEEPDPERYLKEQRQVINVNSNFRLREIPKVVEVQYLKDHYPELYNKYYNKNLDTLENIDKLLKDLREITGHCYIIHKTQVCKMVPISDSPNSYLFQLPKTLNNIKTLRLLSSEIPRSLSVITELNNIIILDLYESKETCKFDDQIHNICDHEPCQEIHDHTIHTIHKIHKKDSDYIPVKLIDEYILPYLVIQLPPGDYNLDELTSTMCDQINKTIQTYTECHYKDVFQVLSDPETDAFVFSLNNPKRFKFQMQLKPHPRVEQLSLYYLLGFPDFQSPKKVTQWSNLVNVKKPNHLPQIVTQKPFRPIDLQPYKYIYLAIKGFGTITDSHIQANDLFAKFQLISSKDPANAPRTLFNTFVCNPKIFLESPLRIVENLEISWLDAWGEPVDFRNQEHSLTFEFVLYLDFLVDSNFSSLRGARDPTSFTESSLRHK